MELAEIDLNTNYLDGDLLKSFQYLSKLDKQKIVSSLMTEQQFRVKDVEDFINSLVA
jgi:hypothetical protein